MSSPRCDWCGGWYTHSPECPDRVSCVGRHSDAPSPEVLLEQHERAEAVHPRSPAGWARFVERHAGPDLIDKMAQELEAQGTTMQPWQILRDLVRRS